MIGYQSLKTFLVVHSSLVLSPLTAGSGEKKELLVVAFIKSFKIDYFEYLQEPTVYKQQVKLS